MAYSENRVDQSQLEVNSVVILPQFDAIHKLRNAPHILALKDQVLRRD